MSLFLLNKREPPKSNRIRFRDPLTAFQAELSLHCPQGFPPRRDALQNAANAVGPIAAGARGQLPPGAQSALQKAQGASGEGSAQAAEQQNTPAQMSAQEAAQALAQAQAAGGMAAYIDVEHALDPSYARRCGVNIDELYISQPDRKSTRLNSSHRT